MSDNVTKVIVGVILLVIGSFVVMWLWNAIIPDVFTGVSKITVLQSLGLMVIVNIFKSNGSSE